MGWTAVTAYYSAIGVGTWQLSNYLDREDPVEIYTVNNNTCLGHQKDPQFGICDIHRTLDLDFPTCSFSFNHRNEALIEECTPLVTTQTVRKTEEEVTTELKLSPMKLLYYRVLGAFSNEIIKKEEVVCDSNATFGHNSANLFMTYHFKMAEGFHFGAKLAFCINETMPTFNTTFSLETSCLVYSAKKEQNNKSASTFDCNEFPLLKKFSYELYSGVCFSYVTT